MKIRQYSPVQLMKWEKRPMTREEVVELYSHLRCLYEAISEANLMFSEAQHRESCYNSVLEDIREEIDDETREA